MVDTRYNLSVSRISRTTACSLMPPKIYDPYINSSEPTIFTLVNLALSSLVESPSYRASSFTEQRTACHSERSEQRLLAFLRNTELPFGHLSGLSVISWLEKIFRPVDNSSEWVRELRMTKLPNRRKIHGVASYLFSEEAEHSFSEQRDSSTLRAFFPLSLPWSLAFLV